MGNKVHVYAANWIEKEIEYTFESRTFFTLDYKCSGKHIDHYSCMYRFGSIKKRGHTLNFFKALEDATVDNLHTTSEVIPNFLFPEFFTRYSNEFIKNRGVFIEATDVLAGYRSKIISTSPDNCPEMRNFFNVCRNDIINLLEYKRWYNNK
ncbi:MAG: hypothetical protein ACOC5T_01030 [Elusimicrobiota bacterium]